LELKTSAKFKLQETNKPGLENKDLEKLILDSIKEEIIKLSDRTTRSFETPRDKKLES
jgi:hypothetical protein